MDFTRIKCLKYKHRVVEDGSNLKTEFNNLDSFLTYINSCSNISFLSMVVTVYKGQYLPSVCLKDDVGKGNWYFFHIFTDNIENDVSTANEMLQLSNYENILSSKFEHLLKKNKRCLIIDSII